MRLFLVHHAEAVSPVIDAERPLSSAGLLHAETLAAAARDAGVKPAAIWHSGKRRSRETAETFWRVCNPLSSLRMVRGLRPEDSPDWMRDVLRVEEQDVLLVGHMPNLPALLHALTGDVEFPLHGLVWLDRSEDGTFVERRRWGFHSS
ncbi:MAG: phosphohistidine phosphatase SixA [Acidobacteriota bacterium]